MQQLIIRGNVEKIGSETLKNCRNLQKITVLGDIGDIGEKAFFSNRQLSQITVNVRTFGLGCDYDKSDAVKNAVRETQNVAVQEVAQNIAPEAQNADRMLINAGELRGNYDRGVAQIGANGANIERQNDGMIPRGRM